MTDRAERAVFYIDLIELNFVENFDLNKKEKQSLKVENVKWFLKTNFPLEFRKTDTNIHTNVISFDVVLTFDVH